MSQQPIDIVVRVQQLTAQAFDQVARELKKLETSATDAGKAASGPLASGARAADDATRVLATNLQSVERHSRGVASGFDAATGKTTLWGGALTSVKGIAAGLVAGFTVDRILTGLGSAITSTIAWGGAITDLSAKTGVSMNTLQRWEYAAKQSGNTLDQVVQASLQLSKRIEEGDKAVEAALTGLGLSLASLQQLDPEDQFNAVADALAKTSDQGERASASMALFGRSGADLLPTLTADMRKLGDEAERVGAVVDEKTLQAMDALGDSWQKMKDTGRGLLAQVLSPMVVALNDLADAAGRVSRETNRGGFWAGLLRAGGEWGALAAGLPQAGALASFNDRRVFPGDDFGPSNPWNQRDYNIPYDAALDQAAKGLRETAGSAREAAMALRQVAQSSAVLRDVNIMNGSRNGGVSVFQQLPFVSPSLLQSPAVLGGQANPWGGIANTSILGGGGSNYSSLMRPGFSYSALGLAGFTTAMPYLSQLVTGGSRGGQIGGSIGGGLGGAIGSMSSVVGALGSFAPFLGPLAGLVGGLIGKLFGPSRGAVLGREADARIGQTQQGLLQQYGSLENIRALGPYGAALADAWGSKNVQGEAWFNSLTKGLQEQLSLQEQIKSIEEQRKALNDSLKTTWDQIVGITEKYGISLEGLGGQVVQLGQTTTWTQMLNDIQALERAGADVGGILVGMTDEMSALVQQSLRAGTEIPANLRPYLQSVADAGKLLDENGVAITDLSTLKWGEPVKTQADIVKAALEKLDTLFSDLTTKLDQIIDRLTNGLPSAASTPMPTVRIPYEFEEVGGGPGRPDEGEPGYATGGLITRTQRALVHEGELIGPVAFMERALAGALRRTGQAVERVIEVPVYLEGRLVARGVAPYLASAAR